MTLSSVLFTTTSNSGNILDHTTGNLLKTYKCSGNIQNNSFLQLENDYFMTADRDKPFLHVWLVNKQDTIKDVRFVLPGPVRALAISPDNGFLTGAVNTKLYTWEISTGFLLSIVEKHLQPVTCLKFAGFYLISASESGSIVTFAHSDLISSKTRVLGHVEPRYTRTDHVGSITHLHVGNFGVRSRFVSVSTDCTCIIYQAATGEPLLKLVLTSALSSVVTDNLFVNVFLGFENGKISQYRLCEAPRAFSNHVANNSNELSFIGHHRRVNCLDIDVNIEKLVSGSEDKFICIWNIQSRSVLSKIDLKASVTNVKFIWNHINIHEENFVPKCLIKSLRRDIDNEEVTSTLVVNHQHDIVL